MMRPLFVYTFRHLDFSSCFTMIQTKWPLNSWMLMHLMLYFWMNFGCFKGYFETKEIKNEMSGEIRRMCVCLLMMMVMVMMMRCADDEEQPTKQEEESEVDHHEWKTLMIMMSLEKE